MAGERAGSAAGSREASPASPLKQAAAAAAGGGAAGAAAAGAGAVSVLTDEQAAEQDMEEVCLLPLTHSAAAACCSVLFTSCLAVSFSLFIWHSVICWLSSAAGGALSLIHLCLLSRAAVAQH
jgi:hypothetical protein